MRQLLSENERAVLVVCQLDAELSVNEIAQRTRLRPHVVRRALDKIRSSRFVTRATYVDVYRLGFSYFNIYVSFAPNFKHKKAILKYLIDSPRVSFLAHTGGEYEYNFEIIARKPADVFKVLDALAEKFGPAFLSKRLLLVESLTDYPMKFLSPLKGNFKTLSFGNDSPGSEIDKIDHRILQLLSSGEAQTVSDAARALKLSNSTVQYRVDRLRKEKVIAGTRYIPDLIRLGYGVFEVWLRLKCLNSAVKRAISKFCSTDPNIYASLRIAGDWDYLLSAATHDAGELDALLDRISTEFADDLIKYEANAVIAWHKISFYPSGELLD